MNWCVVPQARQQARQRTVASSWRSSPLRQAIAASLVALAPLPALAQAWQPVRGSILYGISGMAPLAETETGVEMLVVHDNKREGEGRLGVVAQTDADWLSYRPLDWSSGAPLPVDLEALTAIPEVGSSYVAVESDGTAYHLFVDPDTEVVTLLGTFELPELPEGSNIESFALQTLDGGTVAVWAHRGRGEEPAMLYWATFDPETYTFGDVSAEAIAVPYPEGDGVRHLSDVTIDEAGAIYGTAASDLGDDGPFASAVYLIGVLAVDATGVRLRRSRLVPLTSDRFRKVEAIARVPGAQGGLWLGTDDETFGSFVWRSHNF